MKTITRDELINLYGKSSSVITKKLISGNILSMGQFETIDHRGRKRLVPVYNRKDAVKFLDAAYCRAPVREPVEVVKAGEFNLMTRPAYKPNLAMQQANERASQVYGDRGFVTVTGKGAGKWREV